MKPANTRRSFLKLAGQGLLAAPVAASAIGHVAAAPAPTARPAPTPPKPKITLNIRDFGATGDGTTKDTTAIQQALDRCWVLGGGEVLVPAGN